jgi:hypothetical protein
VRLPAFVAAIADVVARTRSPPVHERLDSTAMSSSSSSRPSATPALLAALLLAACQGGAEKPNATAPAEGGASPAKSGQGAGSGPVAKTDGGDKVKVVDGAAPSGDDRYALQIDAPEAKAGQETTVTVRVVPKAPWHMNLDFPTSLKLDGVPSGVTLAKADLKKADAKLDESQCQFDVKLTAASAGDQTLTGKFKFAVCQDDACSPVTESVEVKVAVK